MKKNLNFIDFQHSPISYYSRKNFEGFSWKVGVYTNVVENNLEVISVKARRRSKNLQALQRLSKLKNYFFPIALTTKFLKQPQRSVVLN